MNGSKYSSKSKSNQISENKSKSSSSQKSQQITQIIKSKNQLNDFQNIELEQKIIKYNQIDIAFNNQRIRSEDKSLVNYFKNEFENQKVQNIKIRKYFKIYSLYDSYPELSCMLILKFSKFVILNYECREVVQGSRFLDCAMTFFTKLIQNLSNTDNQLDQLETKCEQAYHWINLIIICYMNQQLRILIQISLERLGQKFLKLQKYVRKNQNKLKKKVEVQKINLLKQCFYIIFHKFPQSQPIIKILDNIVSIFQFHILQQLNQSSSFQELVLPLKSITYYLKYNTQNLSIKSFKFLVLKLICNLIYTLTLPHNFRMKQIYINQSQKLEIGELLAECLYQLLQKTSFIQFVDKDYLFIILRATIFFFQSQKCMFIWSRNIYLILKNQKCLELLKQIIQLRKLLFQIIKYGSKKPQGIYKYCIGRLIQCIDIRRQEAEIVLQLFRYSRFKQKKNLIFAQRIEKCCNQNYYINNLSTKYFSEVDPYYLRSDYKFQKCVQQQSIKTANIFEDHQSKQNCHFCQKYYVFKQYAHFTHLDYQSLSQKEFYKDMTYSYYKTIIDLLKRCPENNNEFIEVLFFEISKEKKALDHYYIINIIQILLKKNKIQQLFKQTLFLDHLFESLNHFFLSNKLFPILFYSQNFENNINSYISQYERKQLETFYKIDSETEKESYYYSIEKNIFFQSSWSIKNKQFQFKSNQKINMEILTHFVAEKQDIIRHVTYLENDYHELLHCIKILKIFVKQEHQQLQHFHNLNLLSLVKFITCLKNMENLKNKNGSIMKSIINSCIIEALKIIEMYQKLNNCSWIVKLLEYQYYSQEEILIISRIFLQDEAKRQFKFLEKAVLFQIRSQFLARFLWITLEIFMNVIQQIEIPLNFIEKLKNQINRFLLYYRYNKQQSHKKMLIDTGTEYINIQTFEEQKIWTLPSFDLLVLEKCFNSFIIFEDFRYTFKCPLNQNQRVYLLELERLATSTIITLHTFILLLSKLIKNGFNEDLELFELIINNKYYKIVNNQSTFLALTKIYKQIFYYHGLSPSQITELLDQVHKRRQNIHSFKLQLAYYSFYQEMVRLFSGWEQCSAQLKNSLQQNYNKSQQNVKNNTQQLEKIFIELYKQYLDKLVECIMNKKELNKNQVFRNKINQIYENKNYKQKEKKYQTHINNLNNQKNLNNVSFFKNYQLNKMDEKIQGVVKFVPNGIRLYDCTKLIILSKIR